jgi:sugar O-acyltransferase (sialic acid O-acetyltransferase NeuD family)
MRLLGIFGCLGFAKEVGDIAYENNYQPFYVAKDSSEQILSQCNEDVVLEQDLTTEMAELDFVIGIGRNPIRKRIADKYKDQLRFINLIHPSATFGKGQLAKISMRRGVIVCAGVRMTNNISIGDFSIFNLNATIGHDTIVGSFVNIAPGASISGNVHIGDGCLIGTGAVVNDGSLEDKIVISPNTTVGSGAVVVRSCDPDATYAGVPAKRIR